MEEIITTLKWSLDLLESSKSKIWDHRDSTDNFGDAMAQYSEAIAFLTVSIDSIEKAIDALKDYNK